MYKVSFEQLGNVFNLNVPNAEIALALGAMLDRIARSIPQNLDSCKINHLNITENETQKK